MNYEPTPDDLREYDAWAAADEALWQEYVTHLQTCKAGCYCPLCETEKRNVTGH